MSQARKGAVRGRVGVTADDGHARQDCAVFRPDDVHDALARVLEREIGQRSDFTDVAVQGFHLLTGNRVENAPLPVIGGRVVVGRCNDRIHAPGLAPRQLEAFEGLRAGDFVHQVAVYVEQGRAVVLDMDDMAVPEFLVKRL